MQTTHFFSFPGASRLLERTLDWLTQDLTPVQVASVRASVERASRQIERSIQRRGIQPEQLTPTARQQRGWFALFSQAEQFEATYLFNLESDLKVAGSAMEQMSSLLHQVHRDCE